MEVLGHSETPKGVNLPPPNWVANSELSISVFPGYFRTVSLASPASPNLFYKRFFHTMEAKKAIESLLVNSSSSWHFALCCWHNHLEKGEFRDGCSRFSY